VARRSAIACSIGSTALFSAGFDNIFSGYRAFSRRLVKSFPALSSGFEIETELSVHEPVKLPTAEFALRWRTPGPDHKPAVAQYFAVPGTGAAQSKR
jgi:hypothetical protein